MGIPKNLTGKKFGRLLALEKTDKRSCSGLVIWKCLCDCGNIKEVVSSNLNTGHTKSCGCLPKNANKFGNHQIHGMRHTRPYRIWSHILTRCYNLKDNHYYIYGARGIKVCDRWLTFKSFWEDMKEGYSDNLSIDRIDNNGNYEPSNCKWSTRKEQMNNRSDNRYIIFKGIKKTLHQWSEEYKINSQTLSSRLNVGWPIEKALTIPIERYNTL